MITAEGAASALSGDGGVARRPASCALLGGGCKKTQQARQALEQAAGLLRHPLWYRLLSKWLTLALAVLCALVLMHQHTHPEASRALDHLMAPAQGAIPVAEWTGTLMVQASAGGQELVRETWQWVDAGADFGKGKVASKGIALFGFVLFMWLVFALVLKLVGRILLSLVWSRGAGREVRERVLPAFEAQPAPRG